MPLAEGWCRRVRAKRPCATSSAGVTGDPGATAFVLTRDVAVPSVWQWCHVLSTTADRSNAPKKARKETDIQKSIHHLNALFCLTDCTHRECWNCRKSCPLGTSRLFILITVKWLQCYSSGTQLWRCVTCVSFVIDKGCTLTCNSRQTSALLSPQISVIPSPSPQYTNLQSFLWLLCNQQPFFFCQAPPLWLWRIRVGRGARAVATLGC